MNATRDVPKQRKTTNHGPKTPMTTSPKPEAPAAAVEAVESVVPFELVRRFADQMDQLFQDFGLGWHQPTMLTRGREFLRREVGLIPAEWSPRIDVTEADGQFMIRADLPGMAREDIQVEVIDGMVTIQGERAHMEENEDQGYYYNERQHGSFYRAVPLPDGADIARAAAHFHDGVLEIAMPLPKAAKKSPRRLEVHTK